MMKGQKGITLVALIITIIVMLILVGVTISVAINGDIFSKGRTAVDETKVAQVKEAIALVKADYYAAYYNPDATDADKTAPTENEFKTALNNQLSGSNITASVKRTGASGQPYAYTVTVTDMDLGTDGTVSFDFWTVSEAEETETPSEETETPSEGNA